jgi:CDP-glycerol glycerophosphotransferase (TagB/SpsB family)
MTPKEYEDLQMTIVNDLGGRDETYFVVKLHPRENPEYYKEVISSCHAQPDRILHAEDLRSWLPVTDFLVTVNSTVAIEAIIFGVPVILANFSASPYFLDYDSYGAVLSADCFEDVLNYIREFLEYPEEKDTLLANSEKLIRAELGPRDGMAVDRIVNLVKLLTNGPA